MEINVKFIAHSGFSTSLGSHYLLFDYFHGDFPGAELAGFKHIDVFSSHSHSDHFNKKIFTLAGKNPGARFFLSDDIKAEHENAIYMKPGDVRREKDIEVFAFGSTDPGRVLCRNVRRHNDIPRRRPEPLVMEEGIH